MRLGSGVRPIALARPVTLTRQLGENTLLGFASKAVDKLRRSMGATGRPAAGAAVLAELVAAHWRAHPELLAPVALTGLVNEAWLAGFLANGTYASAATVDFLINVEAAVDGGGAGGGVGMLTSPPRAIRETI